MVEDSSTYWKKSRVELRAAGFDPDRTANASAVVTIASAYTNAHRCNNRVRQITDLLVELLAEKGGRGLIVGAPAVSDALTQGTPTAGYSLVSRDIAADCFEIGHYAHHGDAMIVISGCDKTGAAALMPLARANAVGLVLYPGTSSPGKVDFGPWAAKGTNLLGVRAVVAQSFERIHRSNLVGMGVVPFVFEEGTSWKTLGLKGDETVVSRGAGCPATGAVELWTIQDGEHSPNLSAAFAPTIIDFLERHPKRS